MFTLKCKPLNPSSSSHNARNSREKHCAINTLMIKANVKPNLIKVINGIKLNEI